jgi:hypothetical protein
MAPDSGNERLNRLRQLRVPRTPDLSLAFLKPMFKQQVERPHKQVAAVSEAWQQLLPADLAPHTRLEGFSRGVLQVAVDSSARLFELDRLLRGGLERQLITRQKAGLRKVKLRVARWE